MNTWYVKVPRQNAENVRVKLLSRGVFDASRAILREGSAILFPAIHQIPLRGVVFVHRTSAAIPIKPRSLSEALKGTLAPSEIRALPSGFDVIGDIAVIELPDVLLKRSKAIAQALLSTFTHLKVVALKASPVSTQFRVRGIQVVAGEHRTVTVHREFGCRYKLDVASAYFSPRLGTERMRVARQVLDGESVLVMFAGVGPYAILIAKTRTPRDVVAIELNPAAVLFMQENARINKVNVKTIQGDVRSVTPKLGLFDRIVMPLPKDAGDFLDVALPTVRAKGVVHFYDFAETPGNSARRVRGLCRALGYRICILDAVVCGSYAPRINRVCVDFKVLGRK